MCNIVYTVFVRYWLAEEKHRTVEKLEGINNHNLYFDEYCTLYSIHNTTHVAPSSSPPFVILHHIPTSCHGTVLSHARHRLLHFRPARAYFEVLCHL
jgi:hypothetical protein